MLVHHEYYEDLIDCALLIKAFSNPVSSLLLKKRWQYLLDRKEITSFNASHTSMLEIMVYDQLETVHIAQLEHQNFSPYVLMFKWLIKDPQLYICVAAFAG